MHTKLLKIQKTRKHRDSALHSSLAPVIGLPKYLPKESVQKHFQYCKDAYEFCRPAQANVGKTTAHILVGWTLGIWPIRRSTAR